MSREVFRVTCATSHISLIALSDGDVWIDMEPDEQFNCSNSECFIVASGDKAADELLELSELALRARAKLLELKP